MERRYNWVVKFKELEYKYYKLAQSVQPKPDEPTTGGNELYIENIGEEAGVFSVQRNGSPTYTPNLEVKVGNSNWITYNIVEGGTTEVTVPKGSKIYLRGNNPNGFNGGNDTENSFSFTFSQPYNVGGYITSLLAVEDFQSINNIPDYAFCRLFLNTLIKSAEDLITSNITSIGNSSFQDCFFSCLALSTAPTFDKVTSVGNNSFQGCFYNCFALSTPPTFDKVTSVGVSGFQACFCYCTSLVTPPTFANVTSVGVSSFQNCFTGCTSLQTAPQLPATTLADGCYMEMFKECTALEEVHDLPADVVPPNAYAFMYSSCYNLKQAPKIHATEIQDHGCHAMFLSCQSMVSSPDLEITTLGMNALESMFQDCSSLVQAPALPATELAESCYLQTFYSCSSLQQAPILPATILVDRCYELIFTYSGVNNVTALFEEYNASACYGWLEGTAQNGRIVKKAGVEIPSGTSGIPEGWEVVEIEDAFYIENVDTVPGYFTLYKSGTPTYKPSLNYKIDNGEWVEYDVVNLPRIEVPNGSKIYLKGNNTNGFNQDSSAYYMFKLYSSSTSTTGCKCNIGGYITSLLALDNFNLISNIPAYSFCSLFSDNKSLLSAENLISSNITNIGEYGFQNCFNSCTALVTAPTFEKVKYVESHGFEGCFQDCHYLITEPTFENVTSVNTYGFQNCFNSCTALVTSPTFKNVIIIKGGGFERCFYNCTSLGIITSPSPSSWSVIYANRWVEGVPATGTFYKKAGLDISTGTGGIPEGWTVVEV